jgi:hypothetical protein
MMLREGSQTIISSYCRGQQWHNQNEVEFEKMRYFEEWSIVFRENGGDSLSHDICVFHHGGALAFDELELE